MRYLCLSFQRRTAPGGLLCAAEKMTGSHPSDFHSDEISPEMLPGMMVFRKDFIMAEKKKVVVAMSGGVDSTLTARLLLDQGYEVYGATMYQFDGQDEEIEGARKMAEFIGIPFKVIDVREAYQKFVLNYFIESYAAGMTPNPCMMCDFKVKFGLFYDEVRKAFDAPYFATGHYARIVYNPETELFEVRKGLDIAKDQSYMMYHLTQEQLSHIIFPLGRTFKKDTRLISKEKGLPTYNKAESQDICFLTSEKSYVEFLENHDWPGNQRELENEVTRMLIFAKGRVIGADLVSRHILQATPGEDPADRRAASVLTGNGPLKDRLDLIEMRILRETLTRLKWNKSRAAAELGLSRVGLRAKLDRYGIAPPRHAAGSED